MLAKKLLEAAGNASEPNYIESVFSTYLYTGNDSTQTITNGVDLAGKGGLVWIKSRSVAQDNLLYDTSRGVRKNIQTNTTSAEQTSPVGYDLTAFNSTGFSLGADYWGTNGGFGTTYASWTFRKQPKFFDVVTYTGDGVAGRTVAHNLGSVPGSIFFKRLDSGTDTNWRVYHRSLGATKTLKLNTTDAEQVFSGVLNDTVPTSTVFTVGSFGDVNASGGTYVAYLFAHNAGGFGATGTDNVISCGSYTTDASGNATVNLGYEPQWWLEKNSISAGDNWTLLDIARGQSNSSPTAYLFPNLTNAEVSVGAATAIPTATGLDIRSHSATTTYIYIAIRRGPMKVPTSGTSVYNAIARTGTGAAATVTGVGFPPDMSMTKRRNGTSTTPALLDRLRGAPIALRTTSTAAEVNDSTIATSFNMDGITFGADTGVNASGSTYINHFFTRAPGFFDEVCYTGTGVARTINHNLTVVPELMIVKNRTGTDAWYVTGAAFAVTEDIVLNSTAAKLTNASARWNSTRPTASVFSVGTGLQTNDLGDSYVWYGFATCPGVSKVGSYTGTGTTQTIPCGFAAGARFVLIKRTDSTGDWYVWDSARGIVAGNDPYLTLNSTAAEVTTTDYVDTAATGFEISSTAPATINANGGSFIFLAIS